MKSISLLEVIDMDMDMKDLYESTVSGIELVLKRRYGMTVKDAKTAINNSPLKKIFEDDPINVTHTSNETWAREIYCLWKRGC